MTHLHIPYKIHSPVLHSLTWAILCQVFLHHAFSAQPCSTFTDLSKSLPGVFTSCIPRTTLFYIHWLEQFCARCFYIMHFLHGPVLHSLTWASLCQVFLHHAFRAQPCSTFIDFSNSVRGVFTSCIPCTTLFYLHWLQQLKNTPKNNTFSHEALPIWSCNALPDCINSHEFLKFKI